MGRQSSARFPSPLIATFEEGALKLTITLVVGYFLSCIVVSCSSSLSASPKDPVLSSIQLIRKAKPLSLFRLTNNTNSRIEFDGVSLEKDVFYPLPFVSTVECLIGTHPAQWLAFPVAMGSWNRRDLITVEPGDSIVVSVDISDADGKPKDSCRIAFKPSVGDVIRSAPF